MRIFRPTQKEPPAYSIGLGKIKPLPNIYIITILTGPLLSVQKWYIHTESAKNDNNKNNNNIHAQHQTAGKTNHIFLSDVGGDQKELEDFNVV